MEFHEIYPKRVTQFPDGIWRWSYDVDLKTDHTVLHVLLLIPAITAVILIAVLVAAGGSSPLGSSLLLVPFAVLGFVLVLVLAVYRIFRAVLHDTYTLGYEMDEEAILLVYTPGMQRYMNALGTIALSTGVPAGRTIHLASRPDAVRLRSIGSLREHPERDMISIRSWITFLQIWVPREDYAFVRDYLEARRR